MKDLIFEARFLQYASIAAVNDPVSMFHIVEEQNSKLASCGDMACLDTWLASVIGTLEPLYLKSGEDEVEADSAWGGVDTVSDALSVPLSREEHASMTKQCEESDGGVSFSRNERGTFLFASCKWDGESNQVNFISWIYRLSAGHAQLLLKDDNGPFYEQRQQCNGLPDLRTRARVSMGEYNATIYRFDGARYKSYFSFAGESIGDDWAIARYPGMERISITCRGDAGASVTRRPHAR